MKKYFKPILAATLAAGLVTATAAPSWAADREWYGFGCNYGYDVIVHSNAANYVSHTMRSGGTSANNKTKSWQNPIWGQARSWGYGYQTTTFAEAYTGSLVFLVGPSISCS